jgi:glycine cleavage system H protein
VAGKISSVNSVAETNPETLNTDPYGNGWLADVTVDDASAVTSSLLDAAGYKAVIGE